VHHDAETRGLHGCGLARHRFGQAITLADRGQVGFTTDAEKDGTGCS
jgi:hypothetical protein